MRAHARGWCVCVCHGHALSCAVCGVCLRRLLRYPACDVGAACCELLPPRCYCLRIIPPPLTPPWSCVRRVAVRMHKCGAFGSHRTSPLEARMWRHSLWTSSCSSYNGLWKGSLPCSPSMLGRRLWWLHCCMVSQHLSVLHTACGQTNETRRAGSAGAVPYNRCDPVHHATLGGLCGQLGASS